MYRFANVSVASDNSGDWNGEARNKLLPRALHKARNGLRNDSAFRYTLTTCYPR